MGDGSGDDGECYTSGTCDVIGSFRRGVCENPDYQYSQLLCELFSVWNTDEEICIGWRYADSNGATTVVMMGKEGADGDNTYTYANEGESAYIKVYDSSNDSILDLNPSSELPGWSYNSIFTIYGTSTACNGGDVIDNCGICSGSFGGHEANSDIPDGDCDCDGNVEAGCGCGEAGPSGCDNTCGSTLEYDECGICGGSGIPDGDCDCSDNVLDECGICEGPGSIHCGGGIYECNEEDCPDIAINYCLDLHAGANLISFYGLPDDVSISHVMSSIEGNATGVIGEGVAANYNGTDWEGSLNTISSLSGYWVIVSEAGFLCIEDGIPTDPAIQYSLHSGANLISFPLAGSQEISFSLPDDIEGFVSGIIGEGVAADNQPPWQGSLSNLSGGDGYWMITTEDISFSFNVCGVEDADGNCYETIQIGEQLWMSENLKVTHYNDGSDIPTGYSNSEWAQLQTGAYAVYPTEDDNASQSTCGDDCADVYGNLYNWYVVDDSRGLCMDGWHVPSDAEYTILTDYLGGTSVAGGKMKEAGLEHWNSPNTGATNESGFTGLPAGYRYNFNGNYVSMGDYGYFWSSSELSSNNAWSRVLYYYNSLVSRSNYYKRNGFSVRCLGD